MKRVLKLFPILSVLSLPFLLRLPFSASAKADTPDKSFVSRTAEIDWRPSCITRTGGHGPALILPAWLRGGTSRMWTTHPPSARREIYGDRPGTCLASGTRRSPRSGPGHEDCCDPHSRGSPASLGVQKSQGGRARHRPHGRLWPTPRSSPRKWRKNWL